MDFIAYKIEGATEMALVPATKKRAFNHEIKGISLCVPLQIASQWGWWLLNPQAFTVSNDGGQLYIEYDKGEKASGHIGAHFGFGVLTVFVPYVFRTPNSWNTQLRGPANYPKWHAYPFEGIVETSWHSATATMNWWIQDGFSVRFEEGEPLCHVLPVPQYIEAWEPSTADMPPDMREGYNEWLKNRKSTFNTINETLKPKYEGGYRKQANTKVTLSPWTSG
jgi:hypothetical protein